MVLWYLIDSLMTAFEERELLCGSEGDSALRAKAGTATFAFQLIVTIRILEHRTDYRG